MKIVFKIVLTLTLLYALFWGGMAAYFSYAEQHKALLESNLSRVFGRTVTIDKFDTEWHGLSPRVQIRGFNVAGDVTGEPAMAFSSLSAEVSPISLLGLWPRFTEFAVEHPVVEIVSLDASRLQIAGIELGTAKQGVDPQRLISWLMDQQNAAWLDGEVVWRQLDGRVRRYKDISFVYQRDQQTRVVTAAATTAKGAVAFNLKTNGDLFADVNWDGSLEVLGNRGQRLLSSDDLSLAVENGNGRLALKSLDIQRIRDFLQLTGLAENAPWLLESQVYGRLHDMQLTFSGPLLEVTDWAVEASASEVGFRSVGVAPAMSNLRGDLSVSSTGGKFLFSTTESMFEWTRWFDEAIPIKRAHGEFSWQLEDDGEISIALNNGSLVDENIRVFNINASCSVDTRVRRVSNLAQLFKVESVADLSFESGDIVEKRELGSGPTGPLILDASAEFDVKNLGEIDNFFPSDPRIAKFREWWSNAFLAGHATNGKASYVGEVSRNAIHVDKAKLTASADFTDVELDYGYQRAWPKVEQGSGKVIIDGDLLSILPDRVLVDAEEVTQARLQIHNLFTRDRRLELEGQVSLSLPKGMDFLFKGPLMPPESVPDELPITSDKGVVTVTVAVDMPLNRVRDTTVEGTALISEGRAQLPEGVPINDINAAVEFTERTVKSDNITASFLGHKTSGKLITVEPAQPPRMKLDLIGTANTQALEPWTGEHLLTWFDGQADWQSAIEIDGPQVRISTTTDLAGVVVTAPAPLQKDADQPRRLDFGMTIGTDKAQQKISVDYANVMSARLQSDGGQQGSLFDKTMISIGDVSQLSLKPGVNFNIQRDDINLDDWLEAIVDIAQFEPKNNKQDTSFLDAMRSVNIQAQDPFLLGRQFGQLEMSALSVDGFNWIGTIRGENASGTLSMRPRADTSAFTFNLDHLNVVAESGSSEEPPEPIDYRLQPSAYPAIELNINKFTMTGKSLGRLSLVGQPMDDVWRLVKLDMTHNGIKTVASGEWVNNQDAGSLSAFEFDTQIDEAEGVLDDMSFDGFIKKGEGSINGQLKWIGAPHEFDYSRLNGDFDMRIKDGELVKVAPGGGKLLGLLNFNAIARRITFDFRDVFASGLKFDRMQYTGVFSDGEAIMRDAFIFTPAVFVRMEGKIDLDKELIDMEIHMSPELGGNLTLLSALANPAAGAVVFITQQIFKSEMRNSSFKSYRALGTWEDFEMVEFNAPRGVEPARNKAPAKPSLPEISEPKPGEVKLPSDLGLQRSSVSAGISR